MKTILRAALAFALLAIAPARAANTLTLPDGTTVNVNPPANGAPIVAVSPVPNGGTDVESTAVESGRVLKNAPGAIEHLTVTIGATSGWVALLDAVAVPSNGSVTPKWCARIPSDGAGGTILVSWGLAPRKFSTGIVAVFGTGGCYTFTGSSPASFFATVY